jgi:uncharacterized SAM-binding protein YcdF (DUF218 family)
LLQPQYSQTTHDASSQVTAEKRRRTAAWWAPRILLVSIVAGAVVTIWLLASIYSTARSDDTGPVDAIVVLGAAQFNGTPSQVFQGRLDTALELYQMGAADTIVVTGGRMAGDQFTEAESGRNYLLSMGVPAEAVLMEHISTDTAESMSRVGALLEERGEQSVLLVSDGFHLYRAKLLAEDNGMSAQANDADGSPIEQGSMTEFRYVVREMFAVGAYYLGLD